MIAKLNNSNKEKILNYLKEEKELNLFIIGDLEQYGFNEEFLDYWADFDSNGRIIAILMRYYEDFIVYSRETFDVVGFSYIINENKFKSLSGEKSIVEKFSNYVDIKEKRHMHFAKLDKADCLYQGELLNSAVFTTLEDVPKLWSLQTIINGGQALHPLDRLEKKYKDKAGRGYHLINDKGEIVSSAETTAENSCSAMIMGVCTNPSYRGRGYATALVSKLCLDLLSENKTLCLFYDNPTAGEIYKRLGFEEIELWDMWKSNKL